MQYRSLGRTGIGVSSVSFGAGPVSGLLTGDQIDRHDAVVAKAIELGVNWFDTAATYGNGNSERHLGDSLARLKSDRQLHVATKVRVNLTNETDLRPLVVASVKESLSRLKHDRVTLLQVHNSITWNRNDQPTSITPEDVLGPHGLLEGMQQVRAAGLVDHFGLTGIGDADALRTVIRSRKFATIQAPFHLLNPSALRTTPESRCDPDYGGFLRTAHEMEMGIFAIRVFAAGALLGAEPSAHTLKTPFFPLDLYQRDVARSNQLMTKLNSSDWPLENGTAPEKLGEVAFRYVLSQPEITSAIVGFGAVDHVASAVHYSEKEPIAASTIARLFASE